MAIDGGADENRNALNDPKLLWPRGIVPYVFDSKFSEFPIFLLFLVKQEIVRID